MLTRLQTLFTQANPDHTDYSIAFPENLLLEGMAELSALLVGVMEERVRQVSWATLTQRLAAIRKGKGTGFELTGATSATVDGSLTLSGGQVATVRIEIPEGLRIATKDISPKRYRVTSTSAAIEIGESTVSVTAEQAEVVSESYESIDEPNMELLLDKTPYIDDSITVSASDGSYTAYKTFLGVSSTTKAFVVMTDDEGAARVRFGNGVNGAIPQGTISVTYKIGGGVSGEVEANASWELEDTVSDELGNAVTLVFTNSVGSSVGVDSMSVAEAKVRGPLAAQTHVHLVNEDDYDTVATSIPSIARALLVTSEMSDEVIEDNAILLAVAFGEQTTNNLYKPATPNEAQLNSIRSAISKYSDTPPVMGTTVVTKAADLYDIEIEVRIGKTSDVEADAVATNIRNALDDVFAVAYADRTPNTAVDFGARLLDAAGDPNFLLDWSSIFKTIRNTTGVRTIPSTGNNLLLNGSNGSIKLPLLAFPKLGTVRIYDEDQGGIQI
jgi:hypothetical protein